MNTSFLGFLGGWNAWEGIITTPWQCLKFARTWKNHEPFSWWLQSGATRRGIAWACVGESNQLKGVFSAAMEELDGDDVRVSSRGRYAERDIVQVDLTRERKSWSQKAQWERQAKLAAILPYRLLNHPPFSPLLFQLFCIHWTNSFWGTGRLLQPFWIRSIGNPQSPRPLVEATNNNHNHTAKYLIRLW